MREFLAEQNERLTSCFLFRGKKIVFTSSFSVVPLRPMFKVRQRMKLTRIFFVLVCCSIFSVKVFGADELLTRREWKVDGVVREALVHIPPTAKTNAAPVVFAFHGHGGSMKNAATMFHIQTLWPEAIVVYMQGLNTPGRLTDPEGKKPGWQSGFGKQDDRDLKFFDAVLASLKKDYKVEAKRLYSTGHSNGGGFTYLLWEARGQLFAAFAPSASLSRTLVQPKENGATTDSDKSESAGRASPLRAATSTSAIGSEHLTDGAHGVTRPTFLPKPVLHVAGENDPLVKFEWQKMMIEAVRKLNQCGEGKPWEQDKRCTIYKSKAGGDVVTYIHPGTHKYPEEAPAIIVKFFKRYAKP